jgi:hypothetical protein
MQCARKLINGIVKALRKTPNIQKSQKRSCKLQKRGAKVVNASQIVVSWISNPFLNRDCHSLKNCVKMSKERSMVEDKQ